MKESNGVLSLHSSLNRPRRPSSHSTHSEISDLSFQSDELQRGHPLLPITNADALSEPYSRPRSRRGRFRAAISAFWDHNYGVVLVLIAMFFGSGMNIGTRLLETPGPHGEPMHPYQILFVRQSITSIGSLTYGYLITSIPHFPFGPRSIRGLLILRGLAGFVGVFGMYFSLLYLPLSEATVLTFLAPMLSCYVCSWVIPGETFTKQQQLASFVSLVGVVFIAQPTSIFKSLFSGEGASTSVVTPTNSSTTAMGPDSASGVSQSVAATPRQHVLAVGIAMIGVVGATGAYVAIRKIGTRVHAFISINYFSVWCTIVSLFCLAVFPDVKFRLPGNSLEWGLLTLLGCCGFIMQFLMTAGLAYGGVSEERENDTVHDGNGENSHQQIANPRPSTEQEATRPHLEVTLPSPPAESSVAHEDRNGSADVSLHLSPYISSPNIRPGTSHLQLSTSRSPSPQMQSVLRRRSPSPNKANLIPSNPEAHAPIHHQTSSHRAHSTPPSPGAYPSLPRSKSPSKKPQYTPSTPGQGTRATSMVYIQMLFALAADKVFFGVTPTAMSWVGSGLILAGAIWVANATDTKPNHNGRRNHKQSESDAARRPWRKEREEESQEEAEGLLAPGVPEDFDGAAVELHDLNSHQHR